ncbi:MAG: hypothetical protein PVF49_09665 [Anaerolineales bacterium]|jgi:hypothetical protein
MTENPLGGSTISDFARRWSLPESTVWLYIQQGRIRTVKISPRHTRIPFSEEQRLVEQGGVGAGVAPASQVRESA